jgi:hypothetical protein
MEMLRDAAAATGIPISGLINSCVRARLNSLVDALDPPVDPPPPSSAKPLNRAGNCQAASIGRVSPGPVKRKSRTAR